MLMKAVNCYWFISVEGYFTASYVELFDGEDVE